VERRNKIVYCFAKQQAVKNLLVEYREGICHDA